MRAQTIDVKQSAGRVLCCTIFRAGRKKLLAKGHVISAEDAKMLETEGMNQVWVTELEDGEIGEDDAVMQVASEIGCGSLEIRLAAGGRANLFTNRTALHARRRRTAQNQLRGEHGDRHFVEFLLRPRQPARGHGEEHALCGQQLEAVISIVKERGPILQARPIRTPAVAVLYSDPLAGDRGAPVV